MNRTLMMYLAVGVGSGLGAGLRYWMSMTAIEFFGSGFPWATLGVNVLGSALIVWLSRVRWQAFWASGFCGGFTTFSLFSLEVWVLWQGELPWLAVVYLGVSVMGWIMAAGWVQYLMVKKNGCR
nr:CrcB family protein [Halomonas sp.]